MGQEKPQLADFFALLRKRNLWNSKLFSLLMEIRSVVSDFEQVSTSVRVFNRDFVLENVFPTDGGDLLPNFCTR